MISTLPQAGLPADFQWGFATAAYQIEGAIHEDGRGASQWDKFCDTPGKISDGTSGVTACDSYHRTDQDIALLKSLGAQIYRFSIAWPRIIPLGGRNDPINQRGIDYYVKLVDDLLAAGIVPMATIFHWDLPQNLVERYGGFMNKEEFVADFVHYARVVFEALKGKVKHWITFNEPFCSAGLGFGIGKHAPGRTSDRSVNPVGDSSTEPWIVGHNILIAHGHVVKIYREQYKPTYGGEIAITLNGDYGYPWDPNNPKDVEAVERKIQFAISWFADPIYFGRYPQCMIDQLGERLPQFTPEESALLKGSNDFYGMNHYCSHFIRAKPEPADVNDIEGNIDHFFFNKYGKPVGPETQCPWLRPNAAGFRLLLNWLKNRYNNPKIYVTENGTSIKGENDLSRDAILEDNFRMEYFRSYITAMAEAVAEDGVDVRMYCAWSLLDNFEWSEGYETRFGVTFVDYKNGQKRYPKKSAKELQSIFKQFVGQVE